MSQRERPELQLPPATGRKKWRWAAMFGGSTLWISILVHVFFAAVATYVVVEHFTKKHVDFHATQPPAPPTEVEDKVQLAKKNNVESAPPDLKRITTTALSPVALPEVPVTPPKAPFFQLDSGPAPTFPGGEESPPHSDLPEPWQLSE